jgi:tetratricopeptide (TPR) repeat protein
MRVRVLFLAANPVDTDRLRLDQEIRTIDERIQQGGSRDSIELLSHWAVQTGGLANLLMRRKPHVVHFSGHGSVGGILLESRSGKSQVAPPEAVAELFRILKDNIRCVVLNACYSEVQAKAIARFIDVVVGTSAAIGDEDAISFASGFYRAISDGRNLQDAFDLGVVEGQLIGLSRSGAPQLLTSEDPSRIVLTQDHAAGETGPPDPRGDALPKASYSQLSRSSTDSVHDLLSSYKSIVARNPADADAHFQLGLCYLHLRLHDLAIKTFEKALELDPENARGYYYLGLSLVRGRRPKTLSLTETRRISDLLGAAIRLQPRKAEFYYLAAILNYDYYAANGLAVPEPTYESLFDTAAAKDSDSWEVARLLDAMIVSDEYLLSKLPI